jgi:hypothetical protein
MEHRFHALRTIGSIFRISGYVVLVLTILAALAFCGLSVVGGTLIQSASQSFGFNSSGGGFIGALFGGLLGGFLVLLYGGFISLWIIASGELIFLVIGVEENTRKTNFLIENQMDRMAPPASSAIAPKEPPTLAPSEPPSITPAQ